MVAALFRARDLRRATTIEALFDLMRFETLVRIPTEVVVAAQERRGG